MGWRDEYLDQIVGVMHEYDDDMFVTIMESMLAKSHEEEPASPGFLYHPLVLARLRQIMEANPPLFGGQVVPALQRDRRVFLHYYFQLLERDAPPQTVKALRILASDLLAREIAPLIYVVEGILPAGTTLLTGKSKDGKSMMAYNLAVAVASGGKALGKFAVVPGAVWYLALEDGERRAQARLRAQMKEDPLPQDVLKRLELTLWDAPRLTQGLEDELVQWMSATPDSRLVIIDILEKVRPPRKQHGSVYAEDYEATATITRIAQEHNVAVLIIHHANKSNPSDFRDSASGSMSLIGGADNFWSLNRQALSSDATLRITGRDIDQEQELALEFKEGFWSVLGNADDVNQSRERKEILDLLQTRAMTPMQIAEQLEKNRNTIRRLLSKLLAAGKIFQPYEGHYAARHDTEA